MNDNFLGSANAIISKANNKTNELQKLEYIKKLGISVTIKDSNGNYSFNLTNICENESAKNMIQCLIEQQLSKKIEATEEEVKSLLRIPDCKENNNETNCPVPARKKIF